MLIVSIVGLLVAASLSLGACLFLLYTAYIFFLHRKYSNFPSPKRPSFYLGHIPDIFQSHKKCGNSFSFAAICEHWMEAANSDTIVVFFFHQPRVLVADPNVVKMIAMDSKHGKAVEFMKPLRKLFGKRFLGRSVVMVPDYNSWIPQKKILGPVFSKQFLQGLVPKFNSIVDCHLKKLQPLADGKTSTPLAFYIQNCVLSILSECLFSTSLSAMCENAALHITVPARFASGPFREPLMYILWRINEGLMKSMASAAPTLMRFYSPAETKEYQDAISAVRKLGRDQIEARIKAIESGQETPTDLLNHILQLASLNGIGMEELVDNFYTFLGAGFDTTMNMIQFSIVLLVQHPHIMTRVVEEVGEVLRDRTQVTVDDLKKLTYMEQVLYETLRLQPILISGGIPKSLHCDVKVDDHLTIPAKATVMLISSVISRKEKYFEDPEVFNPDRFAPATSPDGFTFFPFGISHRACIGKHFALMETKMFLARFFQTFTVSLPDDYTLVPVLEGLTLKPQGDLDCTLTPVKN